jgi:hypothetical protein
MLTYTSRRSLYGSLTNNTSTANLSLGDTLMNSEDRRLLGKRPWQFNQKTATASTTASTPMEHPHWPVR